MLNSNYSKFYVIGRLGKITKGFKAKYSVILKHLGRNYLGFGENGGSSIEQHLHHLFMATSRSAVQRRQTVLSKKATFSNAFDRKLYE